MPTLLSSDEETEIIGRIPSIATRYGTVGMLLAVFLFLICTILIQFPETITAPVIIENSNTPVKLVAKSSGPIKEINKPNKSLVHVNDIIAIIDNPANKNDIFKLDKFLIDVDSIIRKKTSFNINNLPTNLQVGEIQTEYAILIQQINKYEYILLESSKFYNDRIKLAKSQLEQLTYKNNNIEKQQNLMNAQLGIEDWRDSAYKKLLNEKVISQDEYNRIKKEFISQAISTVSNKNAKHELNLQENETIKELVNLEKEYQDQFDATKSSINESCQKIRGQILQWEKQYVLRAPITGYLDFYKEFKVNTNFLENQPICMIIPVENSYEIKASIKSYKVGKIKENQTAFINLPEFPYEEFGRIRARVKDISKIALDDEYYANLTLANGFITTNNVALTMKQTMKGSVMIVVDNKNLFQRLFEVFRAKVNQ